MTGESSNRGFGIRLKNCFRSWLGELTAPFEGSLELRKSLRTWMSKPLPPFFGMGHYLGGIVVFLFGVQVITGVLLALYYLPTSSQAYQSVQFITNEIPTGWIIREIHAWSAELLIIFTALHLMRVYFWGAYKHPRELNWIIGVLLLLTFVTFAFTGYLLPWDQARYWSLTIGIEKLRNLPLLGGPLVYLMQGGEEISGLTLTRFYVLHAIVLPWIASILLLGHLLLVKRQGLADPWGEN